MNKTQETNLKRNSVINQKSVLAIEEQIGDNSSAEIINEKYAEQVKNYTHYVIGRKISKNVDTYSESEIEEGHLTIKSPSILRILTKWCEELWSKFEKKNFFLDRGENLRVQEKDGNINTMFMWMKIPLNDMIEAEKVNIKKFMDEILANNFDQQTILLKRELD